MANVGSGESGLSVSIAKTMSTLISGEDSGVGAGAGGLVDSCGEELGSSGGGGEVRDQRFGYKCWMAAGNEARKRLFRQVLEMISSVRTMPWMKQEDGCTSQGEELDI